MRRGVLGASVAVAMSVLLCGCSLSGHVPGGSSTPRPTAYPEGGGVAPSTWAQLVRTENARAGVAAGIPAQRGNSPGLAAYADRVSVLSGQTVGLYVSTSAPEPVHVEALRVGYYDGLGFRRVWGSTFVARPQPAPSTLTDPLDDAGGARSTRALYDPWRMDLEVTTSGWPEGMYLFRLDAGAASRYVPLTVRSTTGVGRMLLLDAPMTWQAYNTWGGRSLYGDEAKDLRQRSYAVSFDRPYDDGYGSGRFFDYVAPVLREAERLGLPLAWATDYDLALDPALLDGATTLVIGGHSEYWTGAEHDAVVAAVAAGMNLAVFGANTSYWRVRLAGRAVGLTAEPDRRDGRPRIVFGPKSAALDPAARADPGGATTRFREAPHPRLEELLTGMRYDCHPASADWVVSDPKWWGYAGTGLRAGAHLAHLVGPESDRAYRVPTTPRPMDVVAYSPLRCAGHPTEQTGVYWSNDAGAGVFAAGTMGWPRGMTAPATAAAVTRITANVLTRFASPHAGSLSPADDNLDRFDLPATSTSASD